MSNVATWFPYHENADVNIVEHRKLAVMVNIHAEVYVPRLIGLTIIDQSFSVLERGETAVINLVVEAGLVEVYSMKNHVDQQPTHCPLHRYQMSPTKVYQAAVNTFQGFHASDFESDPFAASMMGLVSPFAGIHNLDLSPESLSADEAHQIWGQLTPHDDSTYDSASLPYTGAPLIRSYQSEAEMYGSKSWMSPNC